MLHNAPSSNFLVALQNASTLKICVWCVTTITTALFHFLYMLGVSAIKYFSEVSDDNMKNDMRMRMRVSYFSVCMNAKNDDDLQLKIVCV